MRNMLNTFLDWAQTYSDVWIVSNQQASPFLAPQARSLTSS